MPWCLLSGLKCAAADSNDGASHLPTLWMWKACSPAGIPLSESLIKTPPGVCVSSTRPTSLPLLSLSAVWADCATAGNESPAVSSDAMPTISISFKIVMNELLAWLHASRPRGDCRSSKWRGTEPPGRSRGKGAKSLSSWRRGTRYSKRNTGSGVSMIKATHRSSRAGLGFIRTRLNVCSAPGSLISVSSLQQRKPPGRYAVQLSHATASYPVPSPGIRRASHPTIFLPTAHQPKTVSQRCSSLRRNSQRALPRRHFLLGRAIPPVERGAVLFVLVGRGAKKNGGMPLDANEGEVFEHAKLRKAKAQHSS